MNQQAGFCQRGEVTAESHCWHPAAKLYTGGDVSDMLATCCWCGARERQTGQQMAHGGFAPVHDPWR